MLRYFFAYRYAVVTGIATSLALMAMQAYQTWVAVSIAAILWGGVIAALFYRFLKRTGSYFSHLLLLFFTAASFAGLTSLIELTILRIALNIAGGCAVFLIHAGALRDVYGLRGSVKQWRRVQMMLWTFAVYGLCTVLFALVIFFPSIEVGGSMFVTSILAGCLMAFVWHRLYNNEWRGVIACGFVTSVVTWYVMPLPILFFGILAGIISGVSAYSLWLLYGKEDIHVRALWALLLGAMTIQFFLVASFALPFGYLALGFLHVWLWYIAQLLIRFHLSSRGIVWKKQIVFLVGNAILFLGMLFRVIRWI